MLLLIQILILSKILLSVGTKLFNYNSPEVQKSWRNFNFVNNFGCANSYFNIKPPYSQKNSIRTIFNGIVVNKTKNVMSKDAPYKLPRTLGFNMKKSLKNYVNIEKQEVEDTDIEFDTRKREDAYRKTDPKENPYAVGLWCKFGKSTAFCSGTLLTDEWVLTAAHCTEDEGKIADKIYVYAGGNSLKEVKGWMSGKALPDTAQLIKSTNFFLHDHLDIALIKLPTKFNLTATVNAINLSSTPWEFHGYRECSTTAFGDVHEKEEHPDDSTRKTQVLDIKQPCLCCYWLKLLTEAFYNDFLCSKPVEDYGLCFGDSGGGLVCDGQLVAVNIMGIEFEDVRYCDLDPIGTISRIIFLADRTGCGDKNTLSVFQATCRPLPWINWHVQLFSDAELAPCKNIKSGETLVVGQIWLIAVLSMSSLLY